MMVVGETHQSRSMNEEIWQGIVFVSTREESGLDSSHKSKTKISFVTLLIVAMMLPYRGIDSDFFVFCFH